MAWKKGTKLIFSKEGLDSFPKMKGKLAIFVERATFTNGLIYVKRKGLYTELWHKEYWRRRFNKGK